MRLTSFDLIDFHVLILGLVTPRTSIFIVYLFLSLPPGIPIFNMAMLWTVNNSLPKIWKLIDNARKGSKWACTWSLVVHRKLFNFFDIETLVAPCGWAISHYINYMSLDKHVCELQRDLYVKPYHCKAIILVFQLLFCFDSFTSVCLLGQMFSTNGLWPPSSGFHRQSAK